MAADPAGRERPELSIARAYPWGRLLQGVQVAFDARKLILAALGLLAQVLGWWGMTAAFDRTTPARPEMFRSVLVESRSQVEPGDWLRASASAVADPAWNVTRPFIRVIDPTIDALGWLRACALALWTVIVWAMFGGAIARIAVLDLAGRDSAGIWTALRFSARHIVALVGAPLSPFVGLGFFAVLCALFGLLYRIPGGAGAAAAGWLAFIPLVCGLVMALIVVGLAAGWPLMVLTVAADGEDAFDALSRSYSYVYQRPWHLAGLAALAWAIGIVGFLFVQIFANLVVQLTLWGLSMGGPRERLLRLSHLGAGESLDAAGVAHSFWAVVVDLLAFGWVYAYFWSASAIIYLLLRRDVDGDAFDDVYQPEGGSDASSHSEIEGGDDGDDVPEAANNRPSEPTEA